MFPEATRNNPQLVHETKNEKSLSFHIFGGRTIRLQRADSLRLRSDEMRDDWDESPDGVKNQINNPK